MTKYKEISIHEVILVALLAFGNCLTIAALSIPHRIGGQVFVFGTLLVACTIGIPAVLFLARLVHSNTIRNMIVGTLTGGTIGPLGFWVFSWVFFVDKNFVFLAAIISGGLGALIGAALSLHPSFRSRGDGSISQKRHAGKTYRRRSSAYAERQRTQQYWFAVVAATTAIAGGFACIVSFVWYVRWLPPTEHIDATSAFLEVLTFLRYLHIFFLMLSVTFVGLWLIVGGIVYLSTRHHAPQKSSCKAMFRATDADGGDHVSSQE